MTIKYVGEITERDSQQYAAGWEVYRERVTDRPSHRGGRRPLYHLVHHSPDGFSWGYFGSGPADLALSILFDATKDARLAWALHQDYKREMIAKLDSQSGWEILESDVLGWVERNRGGYVDALMEQLRDRPLSKLYPHCRRFSRGAQPVG